MRRSGRPRAAAALVCIGAGKLRPWHGDRGGNAIRHRSQGMNSCSIWTPISATRRGYLPNLIAGMQPDAAEPVDVTIGSRLRFRRGNRRLAAKTPFDEPRREFLRAARLLAGCNRAT